MSTPAPGSSVTTSPALSTTQVSLPAPPCMLSTPRPPMRSRCRVPPMRLSFPPSPANVSLPANPLSRLEALLPVMTLFRALPVPLKASSARQSQVFDIDLAGRAQVQADRALDRVGAGAREFGHHVARSVDDVGVVAGVALHGVDTKPAARGRARPPMRCISAAIVAGEPVENVGDVVAGDDVVQGIAGAADGQRPSGSDSPPEAFRTQRSG